MAQPFLEVKRNQPEEQKASSEEDAKMASSSLALQPEEVSIWGVPLIAAVGMERVSSEVLPARVLDVNRFPLPAETDEGAAVSSPNSAMSSFQMDFFSMMNGNAARNRRKRKRDGADRTTSDDEENGSTRKKLRLSKEQTAFLEESFKEHTTLNPKKILLPAAEDTDDGAAVSSPNSAMSSFQMDSCMMNGNAARNRRKRKRDGADRTSDDDENGSTRKMLRLSKEQSAYHEEIIEIFEEHTTPFHEEIFEEHTTPNTEMRRAAERDMESGGGETERPPTMLENPQLRWSFIRKVYSIIAIQLLLTIVVASVVIFVPPVAFFFVSTIEGLTLFIVLIFVPYIRIFPLKYYSLLFILTVAVAFTNGLGWAFESRKVILEAIILTTAVVSSLTLFTFWAARRGHDFQFLRLVLSEAMVVIILFAFIQTLFPLGKLSVMIYGCLASIMYGGYIIYDTDNIIKRLSYDELIWASFSLYLNIISLFSALFTLLIRHM